MYLVLHLYGSLLWFIDLSQSWQILMEGTSPAILERSGLVMRGPNKERFNLIFPGTKWCGSGNIAGNYEDLGSLESTDMCCREHDSCDDVIEAGQTAHGLTNNDFYSKLNCDCDQLFLNCLKADKSKTSQLIGHIYFNVLNTQCFREDYPVIQCDTYYPLTHRCKDYDLNVTAPKLYQFFDVPVF